MSCRLALLASTLVVTVLSPYAEAQNWAAQQPPYGRPDATIDLRTNGGAQLVKGQWRYSDVKVVTVNFRGPGPDLKPSGPPLKTYDYVPHAGAADFDDSKWSLIDPTTLDARRAAGKVCFNWYRLNITIPEKVAAMLTVGTTVVFEINEHGNRRVTRLEKNGQLTIVVDRYQGKRLNSPNDLVYRSDGALYFTDPPFGLPRSFDDPRKELPYSGVFCLISGVLKLVSTDLTGPNGLAFSPDEKYLYVDDWDDKRKIIMRYTVHSDGTLSGGKVFFDATSEAGEDAWDGMKVDENGNLYLSGPGGLWIISPEGKHLGTVVGPEHPHNLAWGDEDAKALYLCAQTGLYRIRVNVPGMRP